MNCSLNWWIRWKLPVNNIYMLRIGQHNFCLKNLLNQLSILYYWNELTALSGVFNWSWNKMHFHDTLLCAHPWPGSLRSTALLDGVQQHTAVTWNFVPNGLHTHCRDSSLILTNSKRTPFKPYHVIPFLGYQPQASSPVAQSCRYICTYHEAGIKTYLCTYTWLYNTC